MNSDKNPHSRSEPNSPSEDRRPIADVRVVFRRGASEESNEVDQPQEAMIGESKLLSPYDRASQVRVEKCIDAAIQLMDDAVRNLAAGRTPRFSSMESYCSQSLQEIASDLGLVLSVLNSSSAGMSEHNTYLSHRSTKLSLLSGIMSHCMGLSVSECRNASIAGLLHDISLFHPFVDEQYSAMDARERFIQHPNRSLELLRGIPDVSPFTQIVITQVHEQMDGSGYPRGLFGHQTSMISRVVNLADAYITMMEAHPRRPAICAPDAIAYLVHQTILGRFDKNCMEALLQANSIYPVGSIVLLQDTKRATVLRSSGDSPTQPVIQLIDPPHSIIDLRRDRNGIEGPLDPSSQFQRLRLSRFDEVLWKHPMIG